MLNRITELQAEDLKRELIYQDGRFSNCSVACYRTEDPHFFVWVEDSKWQGDQPRFFVVNLLRVVEIVHDNDHQGRWPEDIRKEYLNAYKIDLNSLL